MEEPVTTIGAGTAWDPAFIETVRGDMLRFARLQLSSRPIDAGRNLRLDHHGYSRKFSRSSRDFSA